ncbi:MAG: hypothetical protein IJB79_03305 [Candidatus Gastranaerophilales bacterium]|nr:hypothetical protein [Candidatus Gastranaerophilales bacterium]
MDIMQRTGIYHKMKNDDHGIRNIQMADFGSTLPRWDREGLPSPRFSPIEEILIGKYGTSYYTTETYLPMSWKKADEVVAGRYCSDSISRIIRESKSPLTESDIISTINRVNGECDLRRTTAKSLPNLRTVEGILTLDTASPLESLGGLKKVGKINVVAKNLKEMDEYLTRLGILSADGKTINKAIDIVDDIYLVMKNYI